MSMQLLTFLQLILLIALYLGVVVLIPASVFHGKFENHPFYVRYTAYFCIGNFYVMNLVFVLQLFHISSRATLIIGVVVPAALGVAVFHWQDWVKASLVQAGETTHNVIVNTMGFRLFFARIFQNLWQAIVSILKAIGENMVTKWFDWIGTLVIIGIVAWQYGSNIFMTYGYTASDMLVHNAWINAMCNNDIFTNGVYPFGFHCIIYFFHEVFGIKTYVILRLFPFLETMLIHFELLFFLRLISKTESAAYIATGCYVLLNIWGKSAYMRYYSALPQEFGMIFILPCLFFLILFFRARDDENGEKGFKNESTTMLKLFGMNVCMTFAAHFYDTIALGIFCVAFAIAFCRVIFKKGYFGRIMVTGILGLVVAILPMWFAFLCGTQLEGSLRWGLGVMNGTVQEEDADSANLRLNQGKLEVPVIPAMDESTEQILRAGTATASLPAMDAQTQTATATYALGLGSFFGNMMKNVSGYVFISEQSSFGVIVFVMIFIGFILGALALLKREKEQGRMLLAASINLLFFYFLIMSREMGIPVLMDKNRTSVYLGYFSIILLGLVIDYGLNVGMALFEGDTLKKVFPALFAVICFIFLGLFGWVRMPQRVEAFQKNGAIICVTNILKENAPNTFNIISANDELRMTEEYGYHYEVKDLLIENLGLNANNYLSVPSSRVYVFIEKIPGDYDDKPYEGSGSPISETNAMKPLPISMGINIYKGYYRNVVMSKLYYWAKAFQETYENEMSVYYEDDEFICYEIRQNVDRPYDLSFNYGYNN